ncbi:hypothetical protein B0J13DRAFT_607021 [Dactylonectria estremocensis]|uniref:Band 7 domain-containing protein n=1 Tax=Dactylonectria estremocensis TaxID=1079267 RepID=A0A9P9J4Q8_9HYPO|nr:hypothetical protein B0J13DRAFT_607021 [Dactylonectria estremocensis]
MQVTYAPSSHSLSWVFPSSSPPRDVIWHLAILTIRLARSPPTQAAVLLTSTASAVARRALSASARALQPAGFGPPVVTSYFSKPRLPANTVVRFVPQQKTWIVERMGKFNRILEPGLAILVPFIDRIAYVKSLKESAIEIPSQSAITADNVTLELDGVLFTRVFDTYKARCRERAALNTNITAAINDAAEAWGVTCLRYEIRDIHAPGPVVEAMHRQVTAERSKRAEILESEGQHQSAINIAEGKKQSVILASEAMRAERINAADGDAEAIRLKAAATAKGIDDVSRSILKGEASAQAAISLSVAEKYVDAFGKLARESTAVVVTGNVGDISGMIATGLSVYGKVGEAQTRSMAKALAAESSTTRPPPEEAHTPPKDVKTDGPRRLRPGCYQGVDMPFNKPSATTATLRRGRIRYPHLPTHSVAQTYSAYKHTLPQNRRLAGALIGGPLRVLLDSWSNGERSMEAKCVLYGRLF